MTEKIVGTSEAAPRRLGWLLLAVALATPAVLLTFGVISAFKAGELTVQAGVAWLVAAVVIDFLTRGRGALVKANGRIVAASLALLAALVAGYNDYRDNQKLDVAKKELIEQFMATTVEAKSGPLPAAASGSEPQATPRASEAPQSEADKLVSLMGAMKDRAKKFAEESAAIDRKFNSIDLGTVLLPQNLVSKKEIDASRAKLRTYAAAIADRDNMLKRHFDLSETNIKTAGLSESGLRDALAGFNSGKESTTKTYADLTAAQLASVRASEEILNFAQRELGQISVQKGQPLFQTQAQLDEYQRLGQALMDASAVEAKVTERANAQMQNSKQSLVDQLK